MYEPTIVVPSSRFVKTCDWALDACSRNECAAQLLVSVFLYHYDNRLANVVLVEAVTKCIRSNKGFLPIGDWLPYTLDYLCELLFFAHAKIPVMKALDVLVEIGFISKDVPKEISEHYAWNKTWVKVDVVAIKTWLNKVYLPKRRDMNAPQTQWQEVRSIIERISSEHLDLEEAEYKNKQNKQIQEDFAPLEEFTGVLPLRVIKTGNKKVMLEQNVRIVCAFHKHITGKNDSYVYDKERQGFIRARLKEGRTPVQCALAILGNLHSDFHQGKHEKNMLGQRDSDGKFGKVYDDVKYIFDTASRFENMLRFADSADLYESSAKRELEGFLKGIPSRYAKSVRQEREQKSTVPTGLDALDYTDRMKYMSFAGSIASYFKTLKTKDVFELLESNKSLSKRGTGLTDSVALFEALTECFKAFDTILSKDVKAEFETFSNRFAEFQKYNKEG